MSEEVEFGRDWSDGSGVRSEVAWVADTGELYVMKEPDAPIDTDPVGDTFEEQLPTEALTVEVLGTSRSRGRRPAARRLGGRDARSRTA